MHYSVRCIKKKNGQRIEALQLNWDQRFNFPQDDFNKILRIL